MDPGFLHRGQADTVAAMRVETRHDPAFTVARLHLAPGEKTRVESGAMLAHSSGITLSSKAEGGVLAGLGRKIFAGESFFVTTYTADKHTPGWVDVAGALPGDVFNIEVEPSMPFFIARGNWIANSEHVDISTNFEQRAGLFGGNVAAGIKASGQGEVVVSVYGAIDVIDLEQGESVTIDTGHVVAYDLSINFRVRRAVEGRSMQSMKSGEGFVFDFTGPGRVLLQTRNPQSLIEMLTPGR